MARALLTLSTDGWIGDPEKRLARLFGHAMTTDYYQAPIYHGELTSIPYLLSLTPNNIEATASSIQEALTVFLTPQFDNVNVEVYPDADDTESAKAEIFIDIVVEEDGSQFSLGRSLIKDKTTNGQFMLKEIFDGE